MLGKWVVLIGVAAALSSCHAVLPQAEAVRPVRHSVLSVQDALTEADGFFVTQYRSAQYNPTEPPGSNANCGPTSLAMALKALGKAPRHLDMPATAADLIRHVRLAMTGEINEQTWTYPIQVAKGAEALGLKAERVYGARKIAEAVAEPGHFVVVNVNPTPAYVDQLTTAYDGGHFALVTAVEGQQVFLNDPLAPHPLNISLAQLEQALTTSLGTDPFGRLVPAYNGGVAVSL